MRIDKLLEEHGNTLDKERRKQKAEIFTSYLLDILKKEGFEGLALIESEQHKVSQIMTAIEKYIKQYGETERIAYFLSIFTPEFITKIHDYNNHLG